MKTSRSARASACAILAVWPGVTSARAQEAVELPPVVVEGATLDAKTTKRAPKKATPAPAEAPVTSSSSPSKATSTSAASGSVSGDDGASEEAAASDAPAASDGNSANASNTGGVEARKLGTPVSVITGAEMKARQIRHAGDALRAMPGVSVSGSGGPGQITQVRIRGAEGNHTLVIIDGVEANDTSSGEFDFSNLSSEDIERIEVLRGGQSGLYGARAIGGVINIVTRGGKGPLTFRGRAEGGSFGTRDVAGGVSAGNDRGYFAAGYNFQESNGFNIATEGSEEDGYERRTFNLRTGLSIVEGISVDFNLRHSRNNSEFDATNFFTPAGVPQIPVDSPNTADKNIWMGGGHLTWDMFGGGLTHVVGGNFNDTTQSSADEFGSVTYDNSRNRFYYLGTARLAMPETGMTHIFSGLAETERETFTPSGGFNDGATRERERDAYAFEYRGEYFDRFFPTASIRRDENDSFTDFTTWKTGLSIDVREIGIRPHASVGNAVALPGMFEQFGFILGSFVGNPNLAPEESFGWDAGVEFSVLAGKAVVDVTYFETDLQHEIVGFGNTLINLDDDSQRRGIEVAARAQLMPGVVVGAAYTWLDAEDPTGLAEIRRPEHAARFDVNYAFDSGRGNLNVAAIYNGETPDSVFFNLDVPPFFGSSFVTLDSYWLLNIAASYQVAPGVEIYGRIENALNEDYQEVFGFETADVAAYAGVRFTYEELATKAWAEGR